MNKPVSVSIIMGVYNPKSPKRFIQALESIQRQSFFDWELLVYDDGSAEPYQKIIRRAGRLDERIRCLRGMENRGLAHALNVCIRGSILPIRDSCLHGSMMGVLFLALLNGGF